MNAVGRRQTISKAHDEEKALGATIVLVANRRGIGRMVARGMKMTGHEGALDDARTARQAVGRARVDARTAAHSAREAVNYVRIATRSPMAREPMVIRPRRKTIEVNPVLHNRAVTTGAGAGLYAYGNRSN